MYVLLVGICYTFNSNVFIFDQVWNILYILNQDFLLRVCTWRNSVTFDTFIACKNVCLEVIWAGVVCFKESFYIGNMTLPLTTAVFCHVSSNISTENKKMLKLFNWQFTKMLLGHSKVWPQHVHPVWAKFRKKHTKLYYFLVFFWLVV